MLLSRLFVSPILLSAASADFGPRVPLTTPANARPNGISYAGRIFNAIHNSMKQFNSVIQHNGMSLMLATVPSDTEFYHGSGHPEPVHGMQWLAFEPEHAMQFARPRQPYKGSENQQHNELRNPHKDNSYGYLHTYRTKHALKLLYFDGQSAATSVKRTLDTQDILLRNVSYDSFKGIPIEGDRVRGQELCDIAQRRWNGRIDGYLSMVGGFEIILCDFEKHLDLVSILPKGPSRGDSKGEKGLSYAQALSTRFHGIGGGRVSIDYDSFVSALAFPEAVYIDDTGHPRLHNDSEKLTGLRTAVDRLVLKRDETGDQTPTDWQAVADMIASRYSHRIEYMLSDSVTTSHSLLRQTHLALEPFIDDSNRSSESEMCRCEAQFWPASVNSSSVPAQAVHVVMGHICYSLTSAASAGNFQEGRGYIERLKNWLDWASFVERDCLGCALDEVCQLPIWPSGSKEDFEHPRCGSAVEHGSGGYWDTMGRKRGQHR